MTSNLLDLSLSLSLSFSLSSLCVSLYISIYLKYSYHVQLMRQNLRGEMMVSRSQEGYSLHNPTFVCTLADILLDHRLHEVCSCFHNIYIKGSANACMCIFVYVYMYMCICAHVNLVVFIYRLSVQCEGQVCL